MQVVRKAKSRATATGHTNRRIALRRMRYRTQQARMIVRAFRDVNDGDGDTRTAARILNRLLELSLYEQEIDARIADGDLDDAEAAAIKYLPVPQEEKKS